ncbi:MAG: hypothetical protein AVDCRST_MAG08-3634, partial [uncultured Acetobacteraceae bacterium]
TTTRTTTATSTGTPSVCRARATASPTTPRRPWACPTSTRCASRCRRGRPARPSASAT